MWFKNREPKSGAELSREVYISDLPNEIGLFELGLLLGDYAGHFTMKMMESTESRRICIASFDSERLANKAFKLLRKSKFGKRRLDVHKYIHRAYSGERRAPHWRDQQWKEKERRQGERRQQEKLKPYREEFDISIEEKDDLNEKDLKIRGYDKLLDKE